MITCDGCNTHLGPSYNKRAQMDARLLTVNKYVETLNDDIQQQEITAELCNACYVRVTNLMAAVFEDFLAAGAEQAEDLCVQTEPVPQHADNSDIAGAEGRQQGREQVTIEWWNRIAEFSAWLKQRKTDRMAKAASFPLSTMDAVETAFDEVIAKLAEICVGRTGEGEAHEKV